MYDTQQLEHVLTIKYQSPYIESWFWEYLGQTTTTNLPSMYKKWKDKFSISNNAKILSKELWISSDRDVYDLLK